MSLFPRSFQSDFAPLFRLLDDYATQQFARPSGFPATTLRQWSPKFDVKETKTTYELHGELPGIEQKDIQIEFSSPETLSVKGRTERHTESSSDSASAIEGSQDQARITAAPETSYHKPSVEDEATTSAAQPASATSTEVTRAADAAHSQAVQPSADQPRYVYSERSVGEFHRAFTFPSRVDQENVKASLKNGILSIVVPKAQAHTTRRINIE